MHQGAGDEEETSERKGAQNSLETNQEATIASASTRDNNNPTARDSAKPVSNPEVGTQNVATVEELNASMASPSTEATSNNRPFTGTDPADIAAAQPSSGSSSSLTQAIGQNEKIQPIDPSSKLSLEKQGVAQGEGEEINDGASPSTSTCSTKRRSGSGSSAARKGEKAKTASVPQTNSSVSAMLSIQNNSVQQSEQMPPPAASRDQLLNAVSALLRPVAPQTSDTDIQRMVDGLLVLQNQNQNTTSLNQNTSANSTADINQGNSEDQKTGSDNGSMASSSQARSTDGVVAYTEEEAKLLRQLGLPAFVSNIARAPAPVQPSLPTMEPFQSLTNFAGGGLNPFATLLSSSYQQPFFQQQQQQQQLPISGTQGSQAPSVPAANPLVHEKVAQSRRKPPPPPATSNTSRSKQEEGSIRKVPCKARGMSMDHNFMTAYFLIDQRSVKHGDKLVCSFAACRDVGVKFRYCEFCGEPVAKRNFTKLHSRETCGSTKKKASSAVPVKKTSFSDELAPNTASLRRSGTDVAPLSSRETRDETSSNKKKRKHEKLVEAVLHASGSSPSKGQRSDKSSSRRGSSQSSRDHPSVVRKRLWQKLIFLRPENAMDGDAMSQWLEEVISISDPEHDVSMAADRAIRYIAARHSESAGEEGIHSGATIDVSQKSTPDPSVEARQEKKRQKKQKAKRKEKHRRKEKKRKSSSKETTSLSPQEDLPAVPDQTPKVVVATTTARGMQPDEEPDSSSIGDSISSREENANADFDNSGKK